MSLLLVPLTKWKQSEGSHLIFSPPHPRRASLWSAVLPFLEALSLLLSEGLFLHLCSGFPAYLFLLLQLLSPFLPDHRFFLSLGSFLSAHKCTEVPRVSKLFREPHFCLVFASFSCSSLQQHSAGCLLSVFPRCSLFCSSSPFPVFCQECPCQYQQ